MSQDSAPCGCILHCTFEGFQHFKTLFFSVIDSSLPGNAADLLKTDPGSLPEGKVKIRLESDGSLLDVDEDDIEKVFKVILLAQLLDSR